jgi:hypothetical protein
MYHHYLVIDQVRLIFSELINRFLGFIPGFVEALILLIIGYIVGKVVGKFVEVFLTKVLGLERWLESRRLEDAAFGIKVSAFISGLVKWYIYFIFIAAAISTLKIPILEPFMVSFINYYPRIIAAAVIMLFGLIIGEWLREKVLETDILFKENIGVFVKWLAILLFLVMSLNSLMIDAAPILWILVIVVGAIIISISIGVGIAIGLALKDEIKPYVKEFVTQVLKREQKD